MKGIILAAGDGTRLAPHTYQRPKVLLQVGGQAIIDFTLQAFAQVGITDLAIVVGYQGEAVKQWLGDGVRWGLFIRYLFNHHYERGNALSLFAARAFARDELFLLSMADHMVSPELLSRILEVEEPADTLAVDFAPPLCKIGEATRVWVSPEGFVESIGKGLSRWNGVDAGVFLLTPTIFDAIAELIREERPRYELSEAVARLIEMEHPLRACDISGCFWYDIDSPEDLRSARRIFGGGQD